MRHPLLNPDLAPNGFSSFPYVENKLRGKRFSKTEEEVAAFRLLEDIPVNASTIGSNARKSV